MTDREEEIVRRFLAGEGVGQIAGDLGTLGRTEVSNILRAALRERDEALRELLAMIAMVPEGLIAGMRVDPYGTIGDALELIGESREPDSWRALHRVCEFPDPGEVVEEPPCQSE